MPQTARTGPTLNNVAKAAGVSRQTVSNVINAPDRVAPETLLRVQEAIDQLSYRPNRVARSLRTQASRQLGFCVPRAGNPVLDQFIHAITESAGEQGFHVLLFTAPAGADGLDRYGELLAQRAVDGFVLSETVVGDPRHEWLCERDVPFVSFGRTWNNTPDRSALRGQDWWVDVDGASGIAQAVEHLYEQGHRRIAFIGWPEGSGTGDDRLSGYTSTCARLGLATQIVREEISAAAGHSVAGRLLDDVDPPTAIVCVSDWDALGAMRAITDRGLRPGRDIAVTGFDDTPTAAVPGVELTSVRQPIDAVGRAVVDLLVARLDGQLATSGADELRNASTRQDDRVDRIPTRRLFEPTLTIRSSTRPEH